MIYVAWYKPTPSKHAQDKVFSNRKDAGKWLVENAQKATLKGIVECQSWEETSDYLKLGKPV